MARSVFVEGYTSTGRMVVSSDLGNRGYQPATETKPSTPPTPPKGGSAIEKPAKQQ